MVPERSGFFPSPSLLTRIFFPSLLTSCWAAGCEKEHDKIYSLLGIVAAQFPQRVPPVIPDYKLSVAEVFTEVTALRFKNSIKLGYIHDTRKRPRG
jgi:hypothetical protein